MSVPGLLLEDVRLTLRGRPVLRGLSLVVPRGEVTALVGMNGAGKTTALRVALGMLRPDAGRSEVLGRAVLDPDRRGWARVGHLIETPWCYPELTACENIAASGRLHGAGDAQIRAATDRLADALGLAPWLDVPARRLSLGTRQKVGIAAALVHAPRLVILDEPTNALDPMAVVGLRSLVRDAAAEGAAVLVTSHHFDEIARMADRVTVLHGGRTVRDLAPDGPDLERRFFEVVLAADAEAARTAPRPA